ncbi:phage tail tape measure C-terminal domain-containing protein [Stenotrophomonas maltophilia]|uniref:phage tail tape measure C-terminal domain-containing protein n=1 Tax=Stenotrophomonas maltophilia TaxID=40324 RepID=UPI0039C4588F
MADIAELGYKIDSSGLTEGTKALDENAAAAEKVSGATDRLEREYSALARTVERSSSALGDRLGGALDRIGTGTGAVITELQTLNRTNTEILASLGALDGKLASTAAQAQAYGAAGAAAAASTAQVTTASQQLEKQLADQDARLKGVAQRAMEWAASNREANLSERALAEAARDAALGIDHKARVMARAGSEQDRMVERARALQLAEERTARQQQEAARAAEAQKINLQQLLGQINPTVAALNKLADQEDRLARARDLGLLKPQIYQQYQAQLDATRASLLTTSNSVGKLNLQTVEAQQSIVMLARSLASGDLMTAQSSIASLTSRTGLLGGAFTATGLAVGGTVAAIAALGVAAAKGYMEMRDLDRLLIGMGGSAGALTGSLSNARNEIGRMTGDYQGASTAINQVIQSGRVLSENAASIASSATSIASLTGQSIAGVTANILDLADGGTDALAKLNRQYGFLTVASFNHIEAVRSEKGETAALQLALVELERAQNDRVRSMRESAGTLERAWRGVKGEILDTIQAFKNIGRTDIEQRLQEAIWNLHNVRATTFGDPLQSERYMKARAEVSRLLGERMNMQDKEWAEERKRRQEREVIDVQAAAKAEAAAASDSINLQLAGLDRVSAKLLARNKIIADYNKLADNDARHFDGSMQRLIANAEAEVDKRFNRQEGVGRKNADDTSTQTFIANIQRQISANQQLAESGSKVTASDRMVIQARQMLADKTSTMTAASRALLQALIPQLQATDAQAEAEVERQRGMQASIALTERLAQLESQRKKQAAIDLMGLGLGTDETQVMQRKLDIERQYLDEQEKLDKAYNRDRNTLSAEAMAVRQAQYAQDTAALKASLADSLNVERDYQQYRMAALTNWRLGFSHAWKDYAFAAANAYDQAGSVMNTALSGWEDAWVRFAQTGKLSFRDMANGIIADLARIAAKQAAVGIINAVASAWGGGSTYTGNGTGAGSIGGFGNNLANFGGGRANGGPVRGSTLYEVGEGGRPELFNDGRGRTYLIPGNDGQVIPAAPSGSAGATAGTAVPAQVNVNVVVNSDGSTETDGDTSLMQQFGQELGRFVESKYRELQMRDMRDGGVLRSMKYR